MPTPNFFEPQSKALFPFRYPLFAASAVTAAAMFALFATANNESLSPLAGATLWFGFYVGSASVLTSWALFLIAIWFHPQRGSLRLNKSRLFVRSPFLVHVERWWAAMCLDALFVATFLTLMAGARSLAK